MKPKAFSLSLLVLFASLCCVNAYETGYVWHFNLDENLPGSEVPISDVNWNLAYGPTAINGIGDANIISGNSEGGTITPLPLDSFDNRRGFMFASGAGDSVTGFAPQAFLFWTTNLNTVSVKQGEKASGTWETDWMTPAFPASNPLDGLTVGDIRGLSIITLPRNVAMFYRIAVRIDSTWYVDAAGHANATRTAWENYQMDFQSASLYELPFTAGVELDIDVSDNTLVTVASLDPAALVTAFGVYVDTGEFKGSGYDTGTWARFDAFYIDAPTEVAPPVKAIGVGGGSFSVEIDTATGLSYQLVRDTDLQGSFSTTVGAPSSGTGGNITLEDPDYGTVGSDKVFYKIDATLE